MIRIRLYKEGGDNKKRKKEERKGRKEYKKRVRKRRRRRRKREDTCTIADEQPSTLGVLDFRKVLGYRSP
jgi:hypothetical protein